MSRKGIVCLSKLTCLLLIVCLAAVSVSGCKKSATVEPIKIGFIGDLTGDTAIWGQAGSKAGQMTTDEINAAGGILGRQIQFIPMDGRGQAVDSVNAFNSLVDQGVLCVIGTNFSSCNKAIAPIACQKKIPLLGTTCTNDAVTVDQATGLVYPYSFRIGYTDEFQAQVLGKYAATELKAKTFASFLDMTQDFAQTETTWFNKAFVANGGKMVGTVSGRSGDNDFRTQLTKLAAMKPDIILLPWFYKDVALIANQAKELGMKIPFMGPDSWDSPELMGLAGPALEGSYYCSQPAFARPETKPFHDAYVAKWGSEPEAESLAVHDGLYWVKDACERAGKVDPVALRDALESTVNFQGLMGPITVDIKTHNPSKEASLFHITGSKRVFVGDFKP